MMHAPRFLTPPMLFAPAASSRNYSPPCKKKNAAFICFNVISSFIVVHRKRQEGWGHSQGCECGEDLGSPHPLARRGEKSQEVTISGERDLVA